MRLKKSGELEEEATPRFDELFQEESYWEKVRSGKMAINFKWEERERKQEEKVDDASILSGNYTAGENAQKIVELSAFLARIVLQKAGNNAEAEVREPVSTRRSSGQDEQDEMRP